MRRFCVGWSGVRGSGPGVALAAALWLGVAASLAAQERVGGVVVDATTQRPLAGAQIVVEGTEVGAVTDNRGRFLILNVPGDRVTLRVVMIGYRELRQAVEVGRTDVVLAISETAIALDEIVVTGTAGAQQARAVGNAIGRLPAVQLEELAPAMDVQRMLSAHVPGVRIMNTGGEVGTGGIMRIRGVKSITLAATPLVYVDGVRVVGFDNSPALGGVGFWGLRQPSRLNDLNPDDIEKVEIVKGPAAATLYGTEASNGVIHIITKRGRWGAPRVNLTMKQGANWFPDPEKLFPPTYYKCTGASQDPKKNIDPRLRCTPGEIVEFNVLKIDREVYGNEWFQTGGVQSYGGDVAGGSEVVTYFFSADWDRDEGALPYNWRSRLVGRANLSYTPNDRLKFDFGLGGVRSKAQSPSAQQPLSTAIIWACPSPGCEAGSGAPNAVDGPFRGYIAYLPEAYANEIEGFQDVDRTTFSLAGTHTPFPWFNHRLVVGGDFTNIKNSELFRATGRIGNFNNWGLKQIVNLRTTYVSLDYGANASMRVRPDVRLTTSGGVQFYRRQEESTFAHGERFPVAALETVTSGATTRATEDFLENRTFGVFVQEQVAWRDRVFLTGALRGDDNSAFGENFDFVVYPKLSASWVLSDEPRLAGLGWLNTLKLRGAWGKAGKQPDVFDALRTYEPTVGPGATSVLTPENIGNPDLKPEVGEELELGFDASLLDDRVSLEFTYYSQNTTDAIVRVPALPSLGFPGVQFRNIGRVKNSGIELAVGASSYRGEKASLDLRFTLSSTKNKVVDLGGQPPIVQSATMGQYHVEGFPLASIFFKRVVSAELVERGGRRVATNVMCEGGEKVPGTNFSRGGGSPVPCAEAPAVYWGQPVPEWEGGLSATLTLFRNLQLYGLLDFIGGRTLIQGDLAAVHRFFLNSRAILERSDPILLGYEALGGAGLWQTGIIDGDFGKLRTLSATYTLPRRWAERVGAARLAVTATAENMATLWVGQKSTFGHRAMDPERAQQIGGATEGLSAYNQEGWPQLRRFVTTLRVTF